MEYKDCYSNDEISNIKKEFIRLKDKTYLDNAGAALYSESQIKMISNDLLNNLYLNPHTSKYTTDCIDQVRYNILNYFNADQEEYSLIFTSGATNSLKIVAESFNFDEDFHTNFNKGAFFYLQDNHTSVLGMRDLILDKNADVYHITRDDLFETMNNYNLEEFKQSFCIKNRALFAFPALCNFSGYKYPLNWINFIKNGALNYYTNKKFGKIYSEWVVLLDAAAFVSTNKLDFSIFKPDFVCVSFYKIFGYPTGLGALIVKNDMIDCLNRKRYYGGGTVEIAMSSVNFHIKRQSIHERFEDGSISFLAILALKHGLNNLETIFKDTPKDKIMDKISKHTFYLSKVLYNRLKMLKYENGNLIIKLYNDSEYDNIDTQGAIVNFNILRANGDYIGYSEVVYMSELFNINLRSGCFCNPGACQRHLKLTNEELIKQHKAGHKCGDNNDIINGYPTGSIRVSFGYYSTLNDVNSLINMITKCFIENKSIHSIPNHIKNNIKLTNNTNLIQNNKVKLIEIYLYPIKSCAAFKVNKIWPISAKGLKFDREWMIVTETGVPLTQKQDTRMCLIKPSIDLDNNVLKLSFNGIESICIDIKNRFVNKNNVCNSKICGDRVQGVDCGDKVANWLTDVLGLPNIRLLQQLDNNIRSSKINKVIEENSSLSLTNQAQYLLVNLASVKWLSDKVKSGEFDNDIDNLTKRFRGNLIIETNKEFDECVWRNIAIGGNKFKVEGPCTRCQMICIDQESGDKTAEPLRTISKELQGKIHFGIYLSNVNLNNDNFLRCGDEVLIYT